MAACAVTSVMAKDPRFQELREYYKDLHYCDDHLAQVLQLCREYYDYEDDWYPVTPAQKGVFTRFMNHYLAYAKISKTDSDLTGDKVYNLYTTLYALYTPEQLDARLSWLAVKFRRFLDKLEASNPRKTRQELIEAQAADGKNGFVRIMEQIFDSLATLTADRMMHTYTKENPASTDAQLAVVRPIFEYREEELRIMIANKERLTALAAMRIGEEEGFTVNINNFEISFEDLSEDERLEDGGEDPDEDNGEDREEGSKGDRYGDFRTLKLMNTLSVRAKRLISRIPKVNSYGRPIYDDIGVPQFVKARQAAVVLKKVLVKSSPESMMSDLQEAAQFYPWIDGLIDMLDQNPDARSTIYANFKSAETTYVYMNLEKGRYVSHVANSRAQGYALMREAGNNMRAGWVLDEDTSIYTGYGALKSFETLDRIAKEFSELRKLVKDGTEWIRMVEEDTKYGSRYMEEFISKAKGEGRDMSYLRTNPKMAMEVFLDEHPEVPEKIASFLRGIGFVVSARDIRAIALKTITRKEYKLLGNFATLSRGRNRLYPLVDWIARVHGQALHVAKKGIEKTGQYLYGVTGLELRHVNNCLAIAQYKEVEPRVVNEGKSLSTYNNVNLLHQVFDMLTNKAGMSEDEYQIMLENEYLQYEGMALGKGPHRILTGWLKRFAEQHDNGRNDMRTDTRVIDMAGFNHVEYAKLTRAQKLTSSMLMYFESSNSLRNDDFAAYEVPIQADYSTAWNFVYGPVIESGVRLGKAFEAEKKREKDALYQSYQERLDKDPVFRDHYGSSHISLSVLDGRDQYFEPINELYKNWRAKDSEIDKKYKGLIDEARANFSGLYYERNGRVYTSAVVDAITDEVLIELERIASIEGRINDDRRDKLYVYEKQGLKFQIFPEFNTNGFREGYKAIADPVLARDYVIKQVSEQLNKVIEADFKIIDESGILANPALKKVHFFYGNYGSMYAEDGKSSSLTAGARGLLKDYFLNTFYARQQIIKLTVGGVEQFNGLIDYEKRNMLSHATRTSLNTEATWKGKRVGKPNQRVVYIEDSESASAFIEDLKEMCQQLLDAKVISKAQYNSFVEAYSNINTTDGQGFRTLESYRTVMIMADQWDKKHELAYLRIVTSDSLHQLFSAGDLKLFMQNIKPVFTGYEHIPAAEGENQKPVKLTVLHKYSEMVLLPMILAEKCLQMKSAPIQGLSMAAAQLKNVGRSTESLKQKSGLASIYPIAKERVQEVKEKLFMAKNWSNPENRAVNVANRSIQLEKANDLFESIHNRYRETIGAESRGDKVDMFLFHSGVKVGGHGIIQPLALDDNRNRILKSAQDISDFVVKEVSTKPWTVHELPFKYYGIAASTPAHAADDAIAWASQAEKVAWANIQEGDTIVVGGRSMDALKARELYNAIKTANIVETYAELRRLFTDYDELERIFQQELASKSYASNEMMYALAHLKDGTFAIPLFAPNVEHQVQQLLSSIIKKRLTKMRLKGANILQATGLGMDVEASAFNESGALSGKDKLSIVFDGEGENKRIKYVEVYLPIHDSRLLQFADEDGNIGPERLAELEEDETIPKDVLNFIAYRTPSDAEHSVIPCRIKGFIANVAGATIRMPKEIMVMTGHDYDGDKMRCHLPDFYVEWDEEKIRKAYDRYQPSDKQLMLAILGQNEAQEDITSYEQFARMVKSKNNPNQARYKKVVYESYDYSKQPLDNSPTARANARIQLMFSQLTSPEGSRRMIIPGGCDESKVIAKSLYLVRANRTPEISARISEMLQDDGIDAASANAIVHNTARLYDALVGKSAGRLADMMREVSGYVTPYSASHAVDAYETIMGGGEMIGIYAMYNSALQMLQRADMHYVPALTQKGKPYEVKLMEHTFDKLFEVKNHNDQLASLGLARLLNAAVDNAKDSILGYLNQTPEMAEMTFFLFAAGVTEEEIHLIMNQPAVVQLIKNLKGRGSGSMYAEAKKLVEELVGNNRNLGEITQWIALDNVSRMKREEFTRSLADTYEDVRASENTPYIAQQISILQWLGHLNIAAQNLATFVKLTRPESESGAIGTTVSSIVAKLIDLNEFRGKLDENPDNEIRISGMREILEMRDVHEGWDTEYIEEILGDKLPEVVALNSLMLDTSLHMFKFMFPQAKQSWVSVAAEIAGQYNYKKTQAGTLEKIFNEMILWKLLSDKNFITGNPQEEQKRIIVDVPKQVADLKLRISKAEQNPDSDPAAYALVGNVFLKNLTAPSMLPNSQTVPRLQFSLNGPAIEGMADSIRSYWNGMLMSSDKGISKLAIDLFKYNLYTNGFSYGMYEFSHMAPFSVIYSTPGYIKALKSILRQEWKSESERENFINQYYMNHWGDKKFLSWYRRADLPATQTEDGNLLVAKNFPGLEKLLSQRYVIVHTPEKRYTIDRHKELHTLYRVEAGNAQYGATLVKAQKLGVRNRSQQVTLQYNPMIQDYREVRPVVPGNDSAWGQLDNAQMVIPNSAPANINAPGMRPSAPIGTSNQQGTVQNLFMAKLGLTIRADAIKKVEEKAEPKVEKDEEKLKAAEQATQSLPHNRFMENLLGNKMLSIVRRDEEGNVVSEELPATPDNIRQARKQKVFVDLNKRLREILRSKGISVGVLTNAEARMSLGGIADFDTAPVVAEGLLEMIRIAEGFEGEQALPEEFAHVALEMLGHDHPLVKRLLEALSVNRDAMEEAFEGMLGEYEKAYGEDNRDKLALEAAGKLVAKNLFLQQEIQSRPVRNLIHRIVDAIKNLLRKFRRDEVQNAIFEANDIASKIAREMLGGKLLDEMSLEKVRQSGQFLKVEKDLTDKNDVLSKLLKIETKRLSIFKKRLAYTNRDQNSAVVSATEAQIAKLEKAITNYKAEDAIITYMSDSMSFLATMEKSLDDAVNSGRAVNAICSKLNTVRDTLYSFSAVLSAVQDAIVDGEIQDTIGIRNAIASLSTPLNLFYTKYNKIARTYFEEMLSNVYGESGKTVEIGKEKGRVISIKEMGRKADKDISLAARWFNSLADCNDYVLRAIDEVTRNAKQNARQRAREIRPEIEVAMADLIKETGSRDQSFMFEMRRYDEGEWCNGLKDDGKLHRTGRYISKEKAAKLSPVRKKFYDTVMRIKKEMDGYLPESLVSDDNLNIVMMRKYNMERFLEAEGAKGKALEAWEGLKNRVMETGDIDFENQEVVVDFEGNRVDMLPVKFLLKGKNETYDDMSDDVATSLMAYAGMACEYHELNNVVGILENAKYMASQRRIGQKSGRRKQVERIGYDPKMELPHSFTEQFTVEQAQTNAQKALEDFYQMHIYGHIRADEGTIGDTRLSKRKLVDTANAVTSYSQMALNIPQRIANVTTGMTQIVLESLGKGEFHAGDTLWASKIYMKESGDRLAETGKTDYDNKLSLWDEYFDVHQNNGRNENKYKKGALSRWFNTGLFYLGLRMGEDYLASVTSLALARNFKVRNAQGKEETLWDAYEVKYRDAANNVGAYLALKDGYTKLDGSAITFEDEKAFSRKVAGMNFEMQGIYNTDDKSAIQQYAFGALIIMYRKWIAPALKRRYAGVNYNLLKDSYQEGYHRTMFRVMGDILRDTKAQVTEEEGAKALLNIVNDMKALRTSALLNWKNLTDYEKSNLKRSFTELAIVAGLFVSCSLLGKIPPEYTDDERGKFLKWWDQMVFSQMLRLRSEIGSQAPTPVMVDEAMHILNSPFAAIEPLQNTIKAFQMFIPSNWFTEVKSGRYRGHSKSYKYFRELPVISAFKKIDNFIDPSPLIQYYKNDAIR